MILNKPYQIENGSLKPDRHSPQFWARWAGILYLSLGFIGAFGIMYIPFGLFVPGDPSATVANIEANEFMFRLSNVAGFVAQLINIILVLILYKLLKPADRDQAALMAIFFLVSAPIYMLNQLHNFGVLYLMSDPSSLSAFSLEQIHQAITFLIEMQVFGVSITNIFWGLWLFPMGLAIYRSGYIPKFIGVILMIGCFGYLFDSFAPFLFPQVTFEIAVFTFWGEIILPIWLLVKGVDLEKWNEKTAASAHGV